MDKLNDKDIWTISETDIRNSWPKIVQYLKTKHSPVFISSDNTAVPELVILSYEDYQVLQVAFEEAYREKLGKEMGAASLRIAELENRPIPYMAVGEDGIFREVKT